MKALEVVLSILAIVGATIIVPTCRLRITIWHSFVADQPNWNFILAMPDGRNIDYTRMAIQTVILGGGAFLCFKKASAPRD